MLKSIKAIVIAVLAVVILWAPVKIGISIYDFYSYLHPTDAQNNQEKIASSFLKGIKLDDGNYALIIFKATEGRVVTDKALLEANRDHIGTMFDFTKFLPAERPAGYSLHLFKNGVEIKHDSVLREEKFLVPEKVWQAGTVVTLEDVELERNDYVQWLRQIETRSGIYWVEKTPVSPPGVDLQFDITFPTITRRAGTQFDKDTYARNLKQRFTALLGTKEPFTLDVRSETISGKHILILDREKYIEKIAGDINSDYIYVENFEFYQFFLDVKSTQSIYIYLQQHRADIENLVNQDSQSELVAAEKARILQASRPEITTDQVTILGYQEKVAISGRLKINYHARFWQAKS